MSDFDDSGFKKLEKLITDFSSLNGREIRDAFVSNKVVISKSPKEAKSREDYEKYFKTGISDTDMKVIKEHCDHFLKDMINKDLA